MLLSKNLAATLKILRAAYHGYPEFYLLGKNEAGVITDMVALQVHGGCFTPGYTTEELTKAYITLASKKLLFGGIYINYPRHKWTLKDWYIHSLYALRGIYANTDFLYCTYDKEFEACHSPTEEEREKRQRELSLESLISHNGEPRLPFCKVPIEII
jgi:hypothetical protein